MDNIFLHIDDNHNMKHTFQQKQQMSIIWDFEILKTWCDVWGGGLTI